MIGDILNKYNIDKYQLLPVILVSLIFGSIFLRNVQRITSLVEVVRVAGIGLVIILSLVYVHYTHTSNQLTNKQEGVLVLSIVLISSVILSVLHFHDGRQYSDELVLGLIGFSLLGVGNLIWPYLPTPSNRVVGCVFLLLGVGTATTTVSRPELRPYFIYGILMGGLFILLGLGLFLTPNVFD
nr:hypothetical protein [Haloferax larsenii]